MNLPLGHFRTAIASMRTTPELDCRLFAGTALDPDNLADPDLALSWQDLLTFLDNARDIFGPGWFLSVPVLWSAEVQGDFEAAMRCAPTLAKSIRSAERHGPIRWPLGLWQVEKAFDGERLFLRRAVPSSDESWQAFCLLVSLNFQSIVEAAFPEALSHIVISIEGNPPAPREAYASAFKFQLVWNATECSSFIPARWVNAASALADSRAFATYSAGLEAEWSAASGNFSAKVSAALDQQQKGRISATQAAERLGLSLRSLERALAAEGTNFRALQDASLKTRLEGLLRDPRASLASIAEQLGYSDETALSRTCRRLLGSPPRLARQKLQGG